MGYSCQHPGLLAALCSFVLLCATFATFAYFLPMPAAKSTCLRLTCAPAARARRQSTPVTCGGGRVEYSSPHPGLLATFCYFVLLFATFAYFSPIPTAKCTHLQLICAPVARDRCHGNSVTCEDGRVEYSYPHPGLLATLCNFAQLLLLLRTFRQYPQPNAHAYG